MKTEWTEKWLNLEKDSYLIELACPLDPCTIRGRHVAFVLPSSTKLEVPWAGAVEAPSLRPVAVWFVAYTPRCPSHEGIGKVILSVWAGWGKGHQIAAYSWMDPCHTGVRSVPQSTAMWEAVPELVSLKVFHSSCVGSLSQALPMFFVFVLFLRCKMNDQHRNLAEWSWCCCTLT